MNEGSTRDPLDTAIDAVAGELTRGEPGPGFAERVQTRLVWLPRIHPRTGTNSWQLRTYWAAAALVAAVLGIALLLPGTSRDVASDRQTQVAPNAPPAAAAPPVAPPRAPAIAVVPQRQGDVVARRPSGTTPTVTAGPERLRIPVYADAPQIAALRDIPDLAVTVNAPASLAVADLEFPDLAVSPLDPDGQRTDYKELR